MSKKEIIDILYIQFMRLIPKIEIKGVWKKLDCGNKKTLERFLRFLYSTLII
jgi:hypothetical protein